MLMNLTMKSISNLQIIALLACVVSAVSCFLPWAEVNSSTNVMGIVSSYTEKLSGMKSGLGSFVLVVSILSFVLTFFRSKWLYLTSSINLVSSLLLLIGFEQVSMSVHSNIGNAFAGAGVGLYVLFISSITLTAVAVMLFREPQGSSLSSQAISEPIVGNNENTPKLSVKSLNPETKRAIWKWVRVSLSIIGVIVIVTFGFYLYSEHDRKENQSIEQEKYRIDEIRATIQVAAASKDYNQAFTLINSFHWDLNPGDHPDYVKTYNEERIGLQDMVNKMKHEDDSIENRNRLIEQAKIQQAEEQWNNDNALAHSSVNFPFTAIVSSPKCFIYAEPNINSERKAELIQETDLNILSSQNEFFFCNYKTADGKVESGWIYYNDMTR